MLAYAPFGKIIPKGLINEVIAELILARGTFRFRAPANRDFGGSRNHLLNQAENQKGRAFALQRHAGKVHGFAGSVKSLSGSAQTV